MTYRHRPGATSREGIYGRPRQPGAGWFVRRAQTLIADARAEALMQTLADARAEQVSFLPGTWSRLLRAILSLDPARDVGDLIAAVWSEAMRGENPPSGEEVAQFASALRERASARLAMIWDDPRALSDHAWIEIVSCLSRAPPDRLTEAWAAFQRSRGGELNPAVWTAWISAARSSRDPALLAAVFDGLCAARRVAGHRNWIGFGNLLEDAIAKCGDAALAERIRSTFELRDVDVDAAVRDLVLACPSTPEEMSGPLVHDTARLARHLALLHFEDDVSSYLAALARIEAAFAQLAVPKRTIAYTCVLGFIGGFARPLLRHSARDLLARLAPLRLDVDWPALTKETRRAVVDDLRSDSSRIAEATVNHFGSLLADVEFAFAFVDDMAARRPRADAPGEVDEVMRLIVEVTMPQVTKHNRREGYLSHLADALRPVIEAGAISGRELIDRALYARAHVERVRRLPMVAGLSHDLVKASCRRTQERLRDAPAKAHENIVARLWRHLCTYEARLLEIDVGAGEPKTLNLHDKIRTWLCEWPGDLPPDTNVSLPAVVLVRTHAQTPRELVEFVFRRIQQSAREQVRSLPVGERAWEVRVTEPDDGRWVRIEASNTYRPGHISPFDSGTGLSGLADAVHALGGRGGFEQRSGGADAPRILARAHVDDRGRHLWTVALELPRGQPG